MNYPIARIYAFQIVKMTGVTLKGDHHVIPIPSLPKLSHLIVLLQTFVHEGVIQILNSQDWELVSFILTVAIRVPDGVTYPTCSSI